MDTRKESERMGRDEESKGHMTTAEAGQKGGEKSAETRGKQSDEKQHSPRSESSSKGSSSGKKDNR